MLKSGADLSHIFCSKVNYILYKDAGIPIKSYSPEIIVHPILQYATEYIN